MKTATTMTFPNIPLLRQALLLDAIVSGATGVLMAALAPTLARLLELPAPLLFWAGLAFVPYAASLVFLATRDELPRWPVQTVIALNVLWAVDCAAAATGAFVEPNRLGVAFLVMQALAVLAFAEMQLVALRRVPAPRYA